MDDRHLPLERVVPVRGLGLNVREWPATGRSLLLVHGLSSNARTWDGLARRLCQAGYRVVAVDQRGHGLSDKPAEGYGFDQVTADLRELLRAMKLDRPVIAGQSWGGNVVLDFAARHPGMASGIVLVDGGFLELASRPSGTWEQVSVDLRPPDIDGKKKAEIESYLTNTYAFMTPDTVAAVMGNFEIMPDGTIRRRLTVQNHMKILRALWEHRPSQIYQNVHEPVLITAPEAPDTDRGWRRAEAISLAQASLANVRVRWFVDTVHDIHVHRPAELADEILGALGDGFFG